MNCFVLTCFALSCLFASLLREGKTRPPICRKHQSLIYLRIISQQALAPPQRGEEEGGWGPNAKRWRARSGSFRRNICRHTQPCNAAQRRSVCLSVNQSVTSRRGSDQIEQCSVLHVPKGNRIAIQNTATYTRTVVPPFPYFLLDRGLWSSANG